MPGLFKPVTYLLLARCVIIATLPSVGLITMILSQPCTSRLPLLAERAYVQLLQAVHHQAFLPYISILSSPHRTVTAQRLFLTKSTHSMLEIRHPIPTAQPKGLGRGRTPRDIGRQTLFLPAISSVVQELLDVLGKMSASCDPSVAMPLVFVIV